MTKRLIVNADDYGHTPGVCLGIRQAHLEGIVTSTSAMMNRPLAPAELTIAARECPKLGVGVHLVLTTGKPVLRPEKVSSLVDSTGNFHKLSVLTAQMKEINIDQVWAEWNAQVDKFVRHYGKNPDHLDSHHHSSYFTPALFDRMTRLAEQLNCAIRKPFGGNSADAADYLPPEMAEEASAMFKGFTPSYQPRTTSRFIGDFYDEGSTKEHLLVILEEIAADLEHETFEMMCHPARMDHELHEISDYNDKRADELAILTDPEVRKKVDKLKIELIRYADL
jgi:predicted glycoside hydrolase/deacetylase ChbG (UPF0249 family)